MLASITFATAQDTKSPPPIRWNRKQGTKIDGGFVKRKQMMQKFGMEAEE